MTKVFVSIVTSAVAPELSAMVLAVCLILWCTSSCILLSRVLIVPVISAVSGIILERTPLLIVPTVMTSGAVVKSIWRLTICCKPSIICALAAIGSTPPQGCEPWLPLPFTLMVNQSEEAIKAPDLYLRVPTGVWEEIWIPNTASTFGLSNAPSLIIKGAPPSSFSGAPSSAGWNKNTMVPGTSFCMALNILAVAINIAVCESWPQACITLTFWPLNSVVTLEAKGRATLSYTGKASISALKAMTAPGLPPFKTATTPVLATGYLTSRFGKVFKKSAMYFPVFTSLLDSSGNSWKCLLQAISSGSTSFNKEA